MKKRFLPVLSLFVFLVLFVTSVHAQTPVGKSSASPSNADVPVGTSSASPSNNAPANAPLNVQLKNPLAGSGVNTIGDAINKILSLVIRVALPLIIIMFIWSGLSFIFARGNPEKVKTAKNMFLYTVIGTLLILGAWTITNAIIGTVNTITGY